LSLIPRLIDFNFTTPAKAPIRKRMTITTKIKWALPPEGETLCRSCRHAHIQRGFRESEESILCGFGSPLRAVPFKVAECTDFADRGVPERWEMERMALLINVPQARKPTGFRSGVGFAAQEEDEDEDESVSTME